MTKNSQDLPHEFADRFTKPFAQFVRIEAAAGVLLLLATLAAREGAEAAPVYADIRIVDVPVNQVGDGTAPMEPPAAT